MGISPDVPLIVTIALDEIDAQAITDSLDAVAVLNKPFRIADHCFERFPTNSFTYSPGRLVKFPLIHIISVSGYFNAQRAEI